MRHVTLGFFDFSATPRIIDLFKLYPSALRKELPYENTTGPSTDEALRPVYTVRRLGNTDRDDGFVLATLQAKGVQKRVISEPKPAKHS